MRNQKSYRRYFHLPGALKPETFGLIQGTFGLIQGTFGLI
jgi:hypothetical protein